MDQAYIIPCATKTHNANNKNFETEMDPFVWFCKK